MADDDYVHEAGRTSAVRRRRRAVATLAAVVALLLSAFLIALAFNQGWVADRSPLANPTQACVPWTEPPPPRDISVSVYNSTQRKGIANRAAQALRGQQFRVVDVRNDPLQRTVEQVAEIRYGTRTKAQADVLATRFPGATMKAENRTDGILAVALGDKFAEVANPGAPVAPTNPC